MCLKAVHLFLCVQQLLDNSFCMSYADASVSDEHQGSVILSFAL